MTYERFQQPLRLADDRPDPLLDDDLVAVWVDGRRYVTLRLAETSGDPQMRRRVERGDGRCHARDESTSGRTLGLSIITTLGIVSVLNGR